MSEMKIFFYDFMTKEKLKRYIILIAVFIGAIFYYNDDGIFIHLDDCSIRVISITIAFSSTAYIIYTYSTLEKIKLYITLPINKNRIFLGYFLALFSCTLIQRISFVLILVITMGNHIVQNVMGMAVSVIACVILNIGILLGRNSKKAFTTYANIILSIVLFILALKQVDFWLYIVLLAAIIFCSIILMQRHAVTDLIIEHALNHILEQKLRIQNYFFKVLLFEKIYLVNTIFVIAVAIIFLFMSKGNTVFGFITWCLGAINTPVLTMISSDPWLKRQMGMLPEKKNKIFEQYISFLGCYFLFINLIILIEKIVILKEVAVTDVIIVLVLTIWESFAGIYLEKKFPLQGWQTKQELWRNPRKYILPITVFLFVSMFVFVF